MYLLKTKEVILKDPAISNEENKSDHISILNSLPYSCIFQLFSNRTGYIFIKTLETESDSCYITVTNYNSHFAYENIYSHYCLQYIKKKLGKIKTNSIKYYTSNGIKSIRSNSNLKFILYLITSYM